jgi:twitching motility two-component system response regulator PilH
MAAERNVLVVDDHMPMRLLCRTALEAAGIRVTEASDGVEALESIRRDPPDLILLDIMLPRLSGWEVAAELLREPSADRIPIVFISALTGTSERQQALDVGAFGYLTKPLDPAVLAKTVSGLLDRLERGDRESLLAEMLTAS